MIETARKADITMTQLDVLKRLALADTADGADAVSRSILAETLDAPDRVLSSAIRNLESDSLLEREGQYPDQDVSITDRGTAVVRGEYEQYRRIFDRPESIELAGSVCTGSGEGRYFVSLPGYREQFRARLGYDPYPGTLNVELDPKSAGKRPLSESLDGVHIDGWEDEERTYGPAVCYPVTLQSMDGKVYDPAHVVVPERTHHDDDQVELLAPDELRSVLSLVEGDRVVVRVQTR